MQHQSNCLSNIHVFVHVSKQDSSTDSPQPHECIDKHIHTTECNPSIRILCFAGPILLFELCNLGRLKNWLAAQRKVTEDVEDKMITFSVHIARGMQYLHSQQVNTFDTGGTFGSNRDSCIPYLMIPYDDSDRRIQLVPP